MRHSLSPCIHRLFAGQFGFEVDYQAIETASDDFPAAVKELAAAGGRGCNVTVPFKAQALQLARRPSAAAQRAGAANVLRFDSKDDWFGDNTDGRGLIRDLERQAGSLAGARILLLGAGGAAAGVVDELLAAGPSALTILNRTRSAAERLAAAHADLGPVVALDASGVSSVEAFDFVLNATSLGHAGETPELRAEWIRRNGLCYDLNYGAAALSLRQWCEKAGIRYCDGIGMLVEQAALSFELWTSRAPDTASVLAALRPTLSGNA